MRHRLPSGEAHCAAFSFRGHFISAPPGYKRVTFDHSQLNRRGHLVGRMKTNQMLVRSAATIVATGLTLLTSSQSDAHGGGSARMGMGAGHGSMSRGTIQGMSSRAFVRSGAVSHMNGRNQMNNRVTRNAVRGNLRDDRGGHGERRHGRDDGIVRAQRQSGDDHGRHRERGDDKGRDNAVTRGEREPGDDHGRHRERGDDKGRDNAVTRGEREPGDDHGRHRERGDDKGRNNAVTRGEREPGDDHGRHRERGDDNGGR